MEQSSKDLMGCIMGFVPRWTHGPCIMQPDNASLFGPR